MAKRKPVSQFELRFDRHDVLPETIAFRTLSDAVNAVIRLAAGDVPDDDVERVSVSLLDVHRGSAAFRLVTNDVDGAQKNLAHAVAAITSHELSDETAFVVRPIFELSRIARKHDCPILLVRTDLKQREILRIDGETYRLVAGATLSRGDATTAAYVHKVGGAIEPKVTLRVSGHARLLFCPVADQRMARKLAKHLYDWVLVSGVGTWLRRSKSLIRFRVTSFRPIPKGDVRSAFAEIRKSGGGAWDKVEDPAAYLSSVTGE